MALITWLSSQLSAVGGVPVEEVANWTTRGRPGSFEPVGVLLHHTGATASASRPRPSLNTCINGRPDLNGPLCHVMVDYNGICHIVAAGRANHAGRAKLSGPVPAGDGNALYVGIEMDYSGTQTPSVAQYTNTVRAAAAILARLGQSSDACRCHLETSTTGKWDPGAHWTPEQYRAQVRSRMAQQSALLDSPVAVHVDPSRRTP